MKKIFSLLLGFAMMYNFTACSDDEYTDKYSDPSKTATATCERLMTGVFYTGAQYTYNSYWRQYTWDNVVAGKFAQTFGFANSEGSRYALSDSYANDRWGNFYNTLTQFRVLQDVYGKLSDEDKKTYRIFYIVSEVFIYDHLAQIIDIFGDVPFAEAGYLVVTGGDVANSYPAYESATSLYTMILDNLGDLYQEMYSLNGNLSSLTTTYLAAHDLINGGSLTKWMKYCNSLRLRLATRIASQGTLSSKGQGVISEILSGNLPLVNELKENILVLSDNTDVSSTDDPAGLNYGDAFRNGFITHSRASQAMLDVMLTKDALKQNDPRLEIMYSKNAQGEYRGYSTHERYADQQANAELAEKVRVYSRIDSTTVIYNRNLKSPIITAAEVYFLKAEAYQKGWASGDAKSAFVSGMLESVKFYYNQNNDALNTELSSSPVRKVPMPAESDVIAYAEATWDAATNKEEVIITQKWLNFGYFQAFQAWNEVRRTGYPELYFAEDQTAQTLKTPPNRAAYPSTERSYNRTNYQAQIATMPDGDSYYTKIFWAK